MKIVVIGSTGTIGAAVVTALSAKHEVIGVHRKSTPPVDLEQPLTIAALFARVGKVDAVVSVAGTGAWKPLAQLTDADFAMSLASKLMGQVNLIRAAFDHVVDGGSITVTTGMLAQHAMPGAAAISMINAGLEGFVRGAALEAPRGIRVNAVSPPWVRETMIAMKMDGAQGQPAAEVAKAYLAVVEGQQTGLAVSSRAS